jgi:phosphatidylserine decarboxylase
MRSFLGAVAIALLPEKLTGRFIYRVSRSRRPWLKRLLISGFCRIYPIDLSEAEISDQEGYPSFNDFFTRRLKPGARPIAAGDDVIVSPADGTLGQFGRIEAGTLLQAKGRSYTLPALLAEQPELIESFAGGSYLTVYLAPHNYHRVHAPIAGVPDRARYIPGRRFSVNERTVNSVDSVYCRNERVAVWLSTPIGYTVIVLVGALNVASLTTVLTGEIASGQGRLTSAEAPVPLPRGAELGRFNLGSTVVMLFPGASVDWDESLAPGQPVQMGQALGRQIGRGI